MNRGALNDEHRAERDRRAELPPSAKCLYETCLALVSPRFGSEWCTYHDPRRAAYFAAKEARRAA